MILYEKTVQEFIKECDQEIISDCILKEMKSHGFSVGNRSEINSWKNSLPFVADALDDNSIDKDINVAIEYKLDTTKSRIDFIIYGLDENNRDSMVIVELKQWSRVLNSNKQNYVFANGGDGEKDYFHPSYQSYRYKSILENFNEYIQDDNVNVTSCSYLHNLDKVYESFLVNIDKYPFISKSPVFLKDDETKLRDFVKKYIKKGNRRLLYEIDNSNIRPSKDFSNLMMEAIKGQPIFTLDDEQANSVMTIVNEVNEAIRHNRRKTIIIKGGPGTGKSIVAINSMGLLMNPKEADEKPKNVCYCTTNFTPRKLYQELLVNNEYTKAAISNLFKPLASFSRSREFDYDCIMMDEAHRSFVWKFGQGVKKDIDMVDKAFYASRVNVFFIDEDQAVTKDDYLTISKIKDYARKYNSEIIESEELHLTSQFRCTGGKEYIDFIRYFLGYTEKPIKYRNKNNFLKIVDSPMELWNEIHAKQSRYKSTRLLAGYTHEWVSKDNDSLYDFDMYDGQFKMKWNKKTDDSYILDNTQLDRIGSIHTIQGVDMEYAGVIIGKDMFYKDGKIQFDQSKIAKTDTTSGIRTADKDLAEKMIRNTYNVLLTRAIYGVYIYCEDENLNNYLKEIVER